MLCVGWTLIYTRECMKINEIRPKCHFLTIEINDSPCVLALARSKETANSTKSGPPVLHCARSKNNLRFAICRFKIEPY